MAAKFSGWRTPAVILLCGCLIGVLGFGPRSGLGFFLTPMSSLHGWGRDGTAMKKIWKPQVKKPITSRT